MLRDSFQQVGLRSMVFALLCTCMSLSGCVTSGKTPSRWSLPQPGQRSCSEVSGKFSNAGEVDSSTNGKPQLTSVFQFPFKEWTRTHLVKIDVSTSEEITLSSWEQTKEGLIQLPGRSSLKLTCKNGWLYWEGSSDERSEGIGKDSAIFGFEKQKLEIGKGADGALYVHFSSAGGGLVYMFLPIAYSGSDWYRFEAIP